MKRLYESGAEKRKKRKEKELKERSGLQTLTSYLKRSNSPSEVKNSSPVENEDTAEEKCTPAAEEEHTEVEKEGRTSVEQGRALVEEAQTPAEKRQRPVNIEGGREIPADEAHTPTKTTSVMMQVACATTGLTPSPFNEANTGTPAASNLQAPVEPAKPISNDPATWSNLAPREKDEIVLMGPPKRPKNFPRDSAKRKLPESVLTRTLPNGEKVDRDWMVWSKKNQAFFCFPCCLFKTASDSRIKSKFVEEGNKETWKKTYERVKSHEGNPVHCANYVKWKDLHDTLNGKASGVDTHLQEVMRAEERKWRKILSVVVDVVLFLAEKNLAFRGNNSTAENADCGNFLSVLKLISKYNADIKEHLQNVEDHRKEGKRMQAHYLSWETQNEFLKLCGEKFFSAIIKEVEEARYYSLLVDGTPDISHQEQLVFILRYVHRKDEEWTVYERFAKMEKFEQKTGEALSERILKVLKDCGLDISWCRGQGYDNASNMSGKYKGVKTRILEINPQAYFSPCSAHTLNLCGSHAMETSVNVKSFFGNIQKLYNVFAASPARWLILTEVTRLSLHAISTTRWSARIEGVRPLKKNPSGIVKALQKIEDEVNLTAETQAEVDGLINWLSSFEFVLLATIWCKILECIDDSNVILQGPKITLAEAAENIKNLILDLQKISDSLDSLLHEAKLVASNLQIKDKLPIGTRIRRPKKFFDDSAEPHYTFESLEHQFRVQVFRPTMDLLLTELNELRQRLIEISSVFSPLLFPPTLSDVDDSVLEKSASDMVNAYPRDLDREPLTDELRIYYKTLRDGILSADKHCPVDLLNSIFKKGLQNVLPQICVALRLFIVLPVSVASGERAFSKLALTKNHLRATMGQERLNHLLYLSIERKLAESLSFTECIDQFAKLKARKAPF